MKVILFDPFSGAQAIWTTACLIYLGADADKVKEGLWKQPQTWRLGYQNNKESIAATAVNVTL